MQRISQKCHPLRHAQQASARLPAQQPLLSRQQLCLSRQQVAVAPRDNDDAAARFAHARQLRDELPLVGHVLSCARGRRTRS
eukprot:5949462-Pleurochrysis_carterae.AAC.1